MKLSGSRRILIIFSKIPGAEWENTNTSASEGSPGASVFSSAEGFGAQCRIRESATEDLSGDCPVLIKTEGTGEKVKVRKYSAGK